MKKEKDMQNQDFFDIPSFNEGLQARMDNVEFKDNPYRDGTLCSESWAEGWLFTNDELKEKSFM